MGRGEPRGRHDIASWSMQRRLEYAASDFSSPTGLEWLTEWVISDLNRSAEGFEEFASWQPGAPEQRDTDILSALVKNASLPVSAAETIIRSGWWRVKPEVLATRRVDFDILLSALGDLATQTPNSRFWLGASFSLAAKLWFTAVVNHNDYHPGVLDSIVEFAWSEPLVLSLIAARSDLGTKQYRILATHPSPAVRHAVRRNAQAPGDSRVLAALSS